MEDTTFDFSVSFPDETVSLIPISGTQPAVLNSEEILLREAVGALDDGFDSLMNEVTEFMPARVPLALLLIILVVVGFFRII